MALNRPSQPPAWRNREAKSDSRFCRMAKFPDCSSNRRHDTQDVRELIPSMTPA